MPDLPFQAYLVVYLVGVLSAGALTMVFLWTWRHLPLVREYASVVGQLDLRREECTQLQAKMEGLAKDLNDAERVIEQAERRSKELSRLEDELAKLEPKKKKLREISERLSSQYAERAEIQAELGSLKESLDHHRTTQAMLSGQVESLKREVARLEHAEGEVKERTRALEQKEGALSVRLTAGSAELEQARERAARLTDEASAIEIRNRDLRAEQAQLQVAVSALRQQETDAEARMNALAEQLKVFEETYGRTMDGLAAQWEKSLAEWRRAQDLTLEQVERHWEELKNHISQAVEVINGTWNRLKPPQASEAAEKYRDLWEPVIRRIALDDATREPSEREALQETADYLKQLGLVYPERVLHSFHTCLKVNEMSPITVLAGISGTGKSELPRRYAEGMGIHFLGVAVQPRWDSPQDLFGFYNYVESRYKGTELARVLIQAEQFNQSSFPWTVEESLSDRLTLVLLDEMNLARVEYYFSEFLSRLETRRGVDPRDQDQRRAAEIVFEMGAMQEGETEVRVFPAGNILFTGTMNEDETTQTLSDKVLDRANVLRFGKPARLAMSDALTGQPPVSTSRALSFATWESWIRQPARHLGGAERNTLREWTHQLNEAMGELGRPFGHRVALGIEHYAANYPGSGEQAVRCAFADQVEQRIMPRLRGLDPTDHKVSTAFDKIDRLLEKTGDRVILEAFSRGRAGDLFLWAGVDRAGEARA
jgi:hypothetical protein